MFKRKNTNTPSEAFVFPSRDHWEKNPWQAAQRIHDDRIGNAYIRAYNWRILAWISSLIALVSVIGIIFIAAQKKFVPYVVEIDRLGNVSRTDIISEAPQIDSRVERAYLNRFITDFRSVTVDPVPQKEAIYRVYSMLAENTPAVNSVNEQYKKDSPYDHAKKETVSVTVTSILPISDRTWKVEWSETARNLQGNITSITRWEASIMVAVHTPDTEKELSINPLGMFITNFSWTQQL